MENEIYRNIKQKPLCLSSGYEIGLLQRARDRCRRNVTVYFIVFKHNGSLQILGIFEVKIFERITLKC
jgi:hypothetical protein